MKEVWRYNGETVSIRMLVHKGYQEVKASIVVPPLTAAKLTEFLEAGTREPRPEWRRRVREWLRSERPASTS